MKISEGRKRLAPIGDVMDDVIFINNDDVTNDVTVLTICPFIP